MKKLISLAVLLSLSAPVFAGVIEDPASMVHVKKEQVELTSHLKKRYTAYKVTIQSEYPGTLRLDSASIQNGITGQIASINTKTSWWNILWGLPLWLLGMGIAALVISNKNDHATTEGAQYPNAIPDDELTKGQDLVIKALVPVGEQPKLKLHFTDSSQGVNFQKLASL
jgi:hypothetical protein